MASSSERKKRGVASRASLTASQRRALAQLKRGAQNSQTGGAPERVPVASLRDLAAMKLAAIAKRGVRRDYWDLYEILTRKPRTLRATCDDYVRKFGVAETDIYHVLRALTWFEDADADPTPPRGLTPTRWREIRRWFEEHAAKELLRRTRIAKP